MAILDNSAPPDPQRPPSPPTARTWNKLQARARIIASVGSLFIFLIVIGIVAGFFYAESRKTTSKSNAPTVTSLSASDLSKLGQIGQGLGSSGQTLSIGADSLFRGKVDVAGDLSIGGHFSANGPVTLSQLAISGTTNLAGINVGSILNVQGAAIFQSGLAVQGLASISGNLSVSGSMSVGSVNASSISVHDLSISGPLLISHLVTQGPNPTIVSGTALGSGGTVSISGNDTAGTVNFNIGTSPPAGVLGTITFRAPYSSAVHVMLSPLTGAAASTPAYVTRTGGGFQIHTDAPPPGGTGLSYDYIVAQ
jgi:hypothetical protein